eukprot:NODE_541_length_753_cov_809.067093_g532_i0.p1 GENE.NODE_541_length_753_cov_809.067093_g532_i0~~NODE_541_length_753_cov_809.067093_g532_i0.p1  ORF type:complete len:138 (+),score=35.22 NODE_541_length_753_cov_809.067093_g532_i0:14-427(+)
MYSAVSTQSTWDATIGFCLNRVCCCAMFAPTYTSPGYSGNFGSSLTGQGGTWMQNPYYQQQSFYPGTVNYATAATGTMGPSTTSGRPGRWNPHGTPGLWQGNRTYRAGHLDEVGRLFNKKSDYHLHSRSYDRTTMWP